MERRWFCHGDLGFYVAGAVQRNYVSICLEFSACTICFKILPYQPIEKRIESYQKYNNQFFVSVLCLYYFFKTLLPICLEFSACTSYLQIHPFHLFCYSHQYLHGFSDFAVLTYVVGESKKTI